MNPVLRKRLLAAGAAGAVAVAGVIANWFEGSGPTVKVDGQTFYKVYVDPVGVPTVCHGITGAQVIKGKLYSQAECDALEKEHLAIAERAVKRQIDNYDKLTVWQQAALIDFTYNLGEGNLSASTMRRMFNAGHTMGGCMELLKWVKGRVAGQLVTLNGLVDRREVERELCAEWGIQ